ncbi:carbonic anhydrase [Clohesyomyces aquaticus]|uniref:Carbonic anhydrase n=1 Tax=Clohesyomyces aquaticus TaxID=1231657 RepID=A0A1Y1ZBY4_9PLEO|nr:carbonic anhydrase [Clohesyomyces aquaticus]
MVSGPLTQMLARNAAFAQTYQAPPKLLQMASAMRSSNAGVVVLSCSDPRLNPYQILGLDATLKATMIRNAGGRVVDAIRTLAVLQTIGAPGTIAVMHHTDCGMTHYHDADIRAALRDLAPEETEAIDASKFGEITTSIEESVREDLKLLRASPLIRKGTQIVGLKYDIFSGELSVVEEEGDAKSGSKLV